jgi:tetratricopeptide (TPR) repeat protein
MFETNENKRLSVLYEELGNAYDKLYSSMQESMKENFNKTLDETTDSHHQRSLEYRLGNLCFSEKEFSEADQFWKQALKKVEDSQTTMKTILEKLIEKNKTNLSSAEIDSDSTDDEDDEEEKEEEAAAEDGQDKTSESHSRVQSTKSQRRQSTKSINDKEKPEELAQAYLDLEDYESALKYFKKYVAKLEDVVKPSWQTIEIEDEQLPMIKFFHSLLTQTITAPKSLPLQSKDIPDKDVWANLLQAYMKIFTIAVRLGNSSDEITKANLAVFEISQKLYDIPDHLIKVYNLLFNAGSDSVEWNELIGLLSTVESNDILMRLAAFHVSKEDYDNASEIYCAIQNNIQNDESMKSAVNYGMLKLLELHLAAEEKYRTNIMSIDIQSTNIPIFDRILLCRLIVSFWEELEDEAMTLTFQTHLLNLQNETWAVGDLEKIDCIGHNLRKVEDHGLACIYWQEVQNIYKEMLTSAIVTRLYVSDSTFEQVLRMTQEMSNDLLDNIVSLAEAYESLATYEENDDCDEDACESLEKAIVVWSKIPSEKEKVAELEAKLILLKDN